MSRSSVAVIYQPKGAGKKLRSAIFVLDLIADPQSWLTARIGPLAHFTLAARDSSGTKPLGPSSTTRLDAMASRFIASMEAAIAMRCIALEALSARLVAAAPAVSPRPQNPTPKEETEA